jgi:type I restriction enzyme S subunit
LIDPNSWISTLPPSWETAPLKAVAGYVVSNVDKVGADSEIPVRLCNYVDVYKNEFIHRGLTFMHSTATQDEIRKFGLQVDDVVITKDSESWDDIAVPALVTETADDLVCGYHLAVLRPLQERLWGRFLFRCLQARPIRVHLELASTGVTRFGLPKDEIGKLVLPVPPLQQQRVIADYLDVEISRLDGLVEAKAHVLGLLAAKRQALITRAATRGIAADISRRDSGVSWIGELPVHWKVRRLKFLAEVRGGLTLGKNYGKAKLVEYPYLRVANVQDGHLDLSEIATAFVPEGEAASCLLQVGDVLMNEGGDADKLGRGCVWRGEIDRCLHQNHVFAVRPHNVWPEWLNLWTSTDAAKSYFGSRAKQSTNLASISGTNIKELPVPLPPENEQHAIVEYIASEVTKLDSLYAATERTIGLLKERRGALIAAAVTGELAVQPHL